MDETDDPAFLRHKLQEELAIHGPVAEAIERRREILSVIEESDGRDEAVRAVSELLGVGAIGAEAILDLRIERLTKSERSAIEQRAQGTRDQLADLEGSP